MSDRHPAARPDFDARVHYQDESVARSYDRARFLDLAGRIVHALERRLVLRALRALPGVRTVLDLPTGTGRFLPALSDAGYAPSGADVSAAMLRRAASRNARIAMMLADAAHLPLRTAAFDAAMCVRLFPHLDAPTRQAVLREITRACRVGAVVVGQPDRASLWYVVRNRIQRRNLPRHYVNDADLRREFEAAGLRVSASYRLLPFVFMERAYVLTPATPSPRLP